MAIWIGAILTETLKSEWPLSSSDLSQRLRRFLMNRWSGAKTPARSLAARVRDTPLPKNFVVVILAVCVVGGVCWAKEKCKDRQEQKAAAKRVHLEKHPAQEQDQANVEMQKGTAVAVNNPFGMGTRMPAAPAATAVPVPVRPPQCYTRRVLLSVDVCMMYGGC